MRMVSIISTDLKKSNSKVNCDFFNWGSMGELDSKDKMHCANKLFIEIF